MPVTPNWKVLFKERRMVQAVVKTEGKTTEKTKATEIYPKPGSMQVHTHCVLQGTECTAWKFSLFYGYYFFFKDRLSPADLANSSCNQGWSRTSPASISGVLQWQACATLPGVCRAGDGAKGFLDTMQSRYPLSCIPSPLKSWQWKENMRER